MKERRERKKERQGENEEASEGALDARRKTGLIDD